MAQTVKNLPTTRETRVLSLGRDQSEEQGSIAVEHLWDEDREVTF